MTTEGWLFVFVGAVAIAAAVMMLLTSNAVHSALFLILNFACVAFLYLMLDAPFLAMVQITVYAGAIMVLFLFVIMMLGGEKIGVGSRRYRWATPVALFLAVVFLLVSGGAIVSGEIDLMQPVGANPLLQVVNVYAPATDLDLTVQIDGEPVEALAFRETTEFIALSPGEHIVELLPVGLNTALSSTTIALDPGATQTLVAYGTDALPLVETISIDRSLLQADTGRFTVFNALTTPSAVDLVALGAEVFGADQTTVDPVLTGIESGALSDPVVLETGIVDWDFVTGDTADSLVRLRDLANTRGYTVAPNMSNLVILAQERLPDGTLRPITVSLAIASQLGIGSPEAIGQVLFSNYLLPFEMVSVLLLVAIIGAITLTHRVDTQPRPRREGRRKVSRPLTAVIAAQTGHEVTQVVPVDGAAEPLEAEIEPESEQVASPETEPEPVGD